MADLAREFGSLVRRWRSLAAMLAMSLGYLAVISAFPIEARNGSWSMASWLYRAAYLAVFAAVQYVLVRSAAREAGLSDRPRVGIWLGALLAYVALTSAGAFCLQVFSYLTLRGVMASIAVERHFGLMQLVVSVPLFPLMVWEAALISGERSVGLVASWAGIWTRRRYVLAMAAAICGCIVLLELGLETLLGPQLAGFPQLLRYGMALVPTGVGNVLAILLSFSAFRRILLEDVATAAFR